MIPGLGRSGATAPWRHAILWMAAGWSAVNLAWLWHYRRSRLFELDEAGYASAAVRLARARNLTGVASGLQGNHGPMQPILATLPQWVLGVDPATLLWENVLFGAGTGVVTYLTARRLAGRRAGLVAATLMFLSPSVIEFSRLGLTVMPSVFFGSVAIGALVAGAGLERSGWAVVAGLATGCMTLSRSMTIGFVPAIVIAAAGWSYARATPLRTVRRNGALAVVSALTVAAWWWLLQWAPVSAYLFGGGSADAEQTDQRLLRAAIHTFSLVNDFGRTTLVLGAVTYAALRFRSRRPTRPAGSGPGSARLALWPLWAAIAAGIAALGASGMDGVGFTVPLLAWLIPAVVAGTRRALTDRRWTVWAAVMLLTVIVTASSTPGPGLAANVWCGGGAASPQCRVTDDEAARPWRRAIDEVADRIWAAREVGTGDPRVALSSRDLLVNGNSIGLALFLRHGVEVDLYSFFDPADAKADQLREVTSHADVVIATADLDPDHVRLGTSEPSPRATVAAALDAGFTRCDVIDLPDGRTVTILVADSVPREACA
jgi:hypothetical protein